MWSFGHGAMPGAKSKNLELMMWQNARTVSMENHGSHSTYSAASFVAERQIEERYNDRCAGGKV